MRPHHTPARHKDSTHSPCSRTRRGTRRRPRPRSRRRASRPRMLPGDRIVRPHCRSGARRRRTSCPRACIRGTRHRRIRRRRRRRCRPCRSAASPRRTRHPRIQRIGTGCWAPGTCRAPSTPSPSRSSRRPHHFHRRHCHRRHCHPSPTRCSCPYPRRYPRRRPRIRRAPPSLRSRFRTNARNARLGGVRGHPRLDRRPAFQSHSLDSTCPAPFLFVAVVVERRGIGSIDRLNLGAARITRHPEAFAQSELAFVQFTSQRQAPIRARFADASFTEPTARHAAAGPGRTIAASIRWARRCSVAAARPTNARANRPGVCSTPRELRCPFA
jgi:hypothetical protein